jgi:hypothetical protein
MPDEYRRDRDNFENATEAWHDVLERSDLVDSFDQVIENAHTATHYCWSVGPSDNE